MTKNKDSSSILWWIGWITLTILTFFVSCYFWTGFIAKHVGDMSGPRVPFIWVTAVFGSWMVLLVPLIILMYNKVDRAYEDARIARETKALSPAAASAGFKSIRVEESQRLLNPALTKKLKQVPETIKKGHLVTAVLKDGRRVENVFVFNKKDVLGVYNQETLEFQISEIVDVEPADLEKLPNFKIEHWLRFE